MLVNKKSFIYSFLANGMVDDRRVPTNLCPYMRRFFFNVLITGLLTFIIGFTLISIVSAPILLIAGSLLFEDVPNIMQVSFIFGILVDFFLILMGIGSSVVYLIKRSGVGYVIDDAAETVYNSVFVSWLKALHDKVCPELTFK